MYVAHAVMSMCIGGFCCFAETNIIIVCVLVFRRVLGCGVPLVPKFWTH